MPSNDKLIVDALMNQAMSLTKKKQFADAVRLLHETARRFPTSAAVWGLLGSAEFQCANWLAAARAFRQTTKLSPMSEMASLGLFHALRASNKHKQAVTELKRFQAVSHSADYDAIAIELKIRVPVAA